ncbi:hypothetical protein PSCICN_20110 [Pseudomonas cichorii]|nr:hypothetical protein PSCICN_20110 [Pseudomonas cichorii]
MSVITVFNVPRVLDVVMQVVRFIDTPALVLIRGGEHDEKNNNMVVDVGTGQRLVKREHGAGLRLAGGESWLDQLS